MMNLLKQEYEIRHRIACYKDLHKKYILQCYEKNNYELLRYQLKQKSWKRTELA